MTDSGDDGGEKFRVRVRTRRGEGVGGAGRVRGRAGSSLTSRGVGGAAAWQHGMAPVCHGGTVRRGKEREADSGDPLSVI